MKIVKFRLMDDIDVLFMDKYGYIREHTTYSNFKLGQIKNPYDRTMADVGYIGVGKYKLHNEDLSETPAYRAGRNMMFRCYKNEKTALSYYGKSTVSVEWHNFQAFADWYYSHFYEVQERLHLDKDIKYPGNMIYSPENCLLVPHKINEQFHYKPKINGLPFGVNKTKTGRYSTSCNGKSLGVYDTVGGAYRVYARNKKKIIIQLANEYKSIIPTELYEALMKYEFLIENDKNLKTDD